MHQAFKASQLHHILELRVLLLCSGNGHLPCLDRKGRPQQTICTSFTRILAVTGDKMLFHDQPRVPIYDTVSWVLKHCYRQYLIVMVVEELVPQLVRIARSHYISLDRRCVDAAARVRCPAPLLFFEVVWPKLRSKDDHHDRPVRSGISNGGSG